MLQILVVKLACLSHPEAVAVREQSIRERVEIPDPSVERLCHVGAHVSHTLMLLLRPCLLSAFVVLLVQFIDHVVFDALETACRMQKLFCRSLGVQGAPQKNKKTKKLKNLKNLFCRGPGIQGAPQKT